MLLNTIVKKGGSDGMTYYDLQQLGGVPHARIYRQLKKLEDDGLLNLEEETNPVGRPKHLFSISESGRKKIEELKKKMGDFIEMLKREFPHYIEGELPTHELVENIVIKQFRTPIDQIMESDLSRADKLEEMEKIEGEMNEMLDKVKKLKEELQK
jgi:DNA-binding PadR family transcriptional regulator